MAIIDFQILNQANPQNGQTLETLSGSGLGFFGATAGSSVQIGSYQDSTYVSNGDGSVTKDQTTNIKYVADTFPSGRCTVDNNGSPYSVGLSGVPSFHSTLGVRFGHSTPVKVQNAQLRIYDRNNINYPASGVNTKVAEIVNFNGSSWTTQGSAGVSSAAVGSGDAFWWGEPWPSELVTNNYYTNSVGSVFRNGLDTSAAVNGDSRLSAVVVAGNDETVGGTGIIVPLLDSPGSGQKGIYDRQVPMWPKWTQYITDTGDQQTWSGGQTKYNYGDGSSVGNIGNTYGGTGYHTHHTWAVALSASPLSIGSKESYGLYVSLEYL